MWFSSVFLFLRSLLTALKRRYYLSSLRHSLFFNRKFFQTQGWVRERLLARVPSSDSWFSPWLFMHQALCPGWAGGYPSGEERQKSSGFPPTQGDFLSLKFKLNHVDQMIKHITNEMFFWILHIFYWKDCHTQHDIHVVSITLLKTGMAYLNLIT